MITHSTKPSFFNHGDLNSAAPNHLIFKSGDKVLQYRLARMTTRNRRDIM